MAKTPVTGRHRSTAGADPSRGFVSQAGAMLRLALYTLIFGGVCILSNRAEVHAEKSFFIGSLNTAEQFTSAFEGFRARMTELGYREPRNVRYQFYNSRGNSELLATFARRLVQDNVDLIVTSSTTATAAAAAATEKTRIPVLFLSAGNPEMLARSYAGSGNHLAGISSGSLELLAKRFELLQELTPAAKRVAIVHHPPGINYKANLAETREAAHRFGIKLGEFNAVTLQDIDNGAREITRQKFHAIFAPPDSFITENIDILVRQAIREKLPFITSLLVNVERGCLATYASNYRALGKQGAALADKILKGALPGSLPIEMPEKVNLVLNLKTAKAIDLRIPREILLRADQVFE